MVTGTRDIGGARSLQDDSQRRARAAAAARYEGLAAEVLGEGATPEERAVNRLTAPYYYLFDLDLFIETLARKVSDQGIAPRLNAVMEQETYAERLRRLWEIKAPGIVGPGNIASEKGGLAAAVEVAKRALRHDSRDSSTVILNDQAILEAIGVMLERIDVEFAKGLLGRATLEDPTVGRSLGMIGGDIEPATLADAVNNLSRAELEIVNIGRAVESTTGELIATGTYQVASDGEVTLQVGSGESRVVEGGQDVLETSAAVAGGGDIPGFAPTETIEDLPIPIGVPPDFSRTLPVGPIPEGFSASAATTFEQKPRYFLYDEMRIPETMTDAVMRAVMADMVEAGLLNPLTVHGGDPNSPVIWTEDAASAFRTVLAHGNFMGIPWQEALEQKRVSPIRNQYNTFTPGTFEKRDPDELAQTVKATFRQVLGREPAADEISSLSGLLLTEYQAQFASEEAQRRAEFDREQAVLRGETTDTGPVTTQGQDPVASFLEAFDSRYQPEIKRNTARVEGQQLTADFRSMFTNTRSNI